MVFCGGMARFGIAEIFVIVCVGTPAVHKQRLQAEEDIIQAQPSGDLKRQILARGFIHDREQLDGKTVLCPQRHEVVGPDMIGLLWAESGTGTISQPEEPAWRLAQWQLEPFPSPDPFPVCMIHSLAVVVQQGYDPPIPTVPILARQLNDRRRQRDLIIRGSGLIPLS